LYDAKNKDIIQEENPTRRYIEIHGKGKVQAVREEEIETRGICTLRSLQ